MEIETDRLEADHLVHIHHLPAVHADRHSSGAAVSIPVRVRGEERHPSREESVMQTHVRIQTETDRVERKRPRNSAKREK